MIDDGAPLESPPQEKCGEGHDQSRVKAKLEVHREDRLIESTSESQIATQQAQLSLDGHLL